MNVPQLKGWDLFPMLLTLGVGLGTVAYGYWQMRGTPRLEIQTPEGQFVFPMNVDRYFEARGPLGTSLIKIENGQAWFESSPCQNKICIQMGHQHHVGQWAACLPNRILVRITANQEDVDAITQ